jgi:hypothetical protein
MPIEEEAGLAPESVLIHLKIEASIVVSAKPTRTRRLSKSLHGH